MTTAQAQQFPFNAAFQEALFSYLLRDFNQYGLLVPPGAFSVEYLELPWVEVQDFYRQYKELPEPETLLERVLSKIPGKSQRELVSGKLTEVLNRPPRNTEFMRETLTDFLRRQQVMKLADELQMLCAAQEKLDLLSIRQQLDEAATLGLPDIEKGNYFHEVDERLQRYLEGDITEQIPTNIGEITLGKGELGVVMAPRKRGKTLMLVNIGRGGLLYGYRVLHVTMEVHEAPLKLRYDRALSGLTKGALRLAENYERAKLAIAKVQELGQALVVREFTPGKFSCDNLYGVLKFYETHGQPFDLVIVDYADLMEPPRHYKDRRFELSGIYTALRGIAGDFGVAVWTASQTTRESGKKEIVESDDAAEDIGKIAIADKVVTVCQTLEEHKMIPEMFRLLTAAVREEKDYDLILCEVDRDLSRVRAR